VSAVSLPDDDAMVQLVEAAGAGDRDALAGLWDGMAPWVHAALLRMLRDPEAAELLTRRTFVEIWRLAPLWDQHFGRPLLWALATARTLGSQWLDDARRRHAEGPATTAPTATERAQAREPGSQVGAALESLGPEARDALEAAWFCHPVDEDGVRDVQPDVYGPALQAFARALAGG
jgi:RNA polymerase sigma-70 factor (ECF subfamily)